MRRGYDSVGGYPRKPSSQALASSDVARIRVTTLIDAPPAEVWDYLEDIESHVDWMADARAIRFVTEQRRGVGTRYECDTRVGPLRLNDVMEITEWVPGKAMSVRHGGLVAGSGRFSLKKARRGRTFFQWREKLTFPLWLGGPVGALAAKPVLRRIWRRNLERLAERFRD